MILERFFDDKLAHASYLVGCEDERVAIVIDPSRDLEQYLAFAKSKHLRIRAVTETHIHADYLSGSRELAAKTGADLYLSDEGEPDWQYRFTEPNVKLVKGGDIIEVGNLRLEVVKTPGHTPEHISFILSDVRNGIPMGAFTGDFIFVGDVGRPDLLEKAANIKGAMEVGARELYQSVTRFRNSYPLHLLLWPAHGAGSSCGKALSAVPVSTLGYESQANWALRGTSEEDFVKEVLTGQPDPPTYFGRMKEMNRQGPPILGKLPEPHHELDYSKISDLLRDGAIVLDIRNSDEHAAGFIPGTAHVPLNSSFTNWAGWLLAPDKPIYLLAPNEDAVKEAVKALVTIGLDDIRGWFGREAIAGMRHSLATIAEATFDEAFEKDALILDVRSNGEWNEGHVPEAVHIPLGYLQSRAGELPKNRPIAVHCHGGSRSYIAAAILHNLGYNVVNVDEGFLGYLKSGKRVLIGQSS